MTIVTISVADQTNPIEVQNWLDNNPTMSIFDVLKDGACFYILCQ